MGGDRKVRPETEMPEKKRNVAKVLPLINQKKEKVRGARQLKK